MLWLVAKFLFTGQLKFKDGKILFLEEPLGMIPIHFIVGLTRYFEEKKRLEDLYILGWILGFIFTKSVSEKYGFKRPEEIYRWGMDFASSWGFGDYKTVNWDPKTYSHFVIYNNPVPEYFRKRKEPIDHFIVGAMGGGGTVVRNKICQTLEIKCRAQGYPCCEMITATNEWFKEKKYWTLLQKLYNIEKWLPLQEDLFKNFDKYKKNSNFIEFFEDKLPQYLNK